MWAVAGLETDTMNKPLATFLMFSLFGLSGATAIAKPIAPGTAMAAPNDRTAKVVLSRYVAWRGGAAFTRLRSLRETGDFSDGGLHGMGYRYAASVGQVITRSQFGPFSTTLQVDASHGEYTDLAGQRLPLSVLEVGYARVDAMLLMPLAFDAAVKLATKPAEMIGGRSWDVVVIDRGDGGRYDYLIAADTGELFGVRIYRNGSESMQTYTDWRMVDGVRLPFRVHDEGHAGLGALQSDTTDFTIVHASLNPPAAAPAPLPNRQVAHFADGASSSGWIPFSLDGGAIFLDITIDGHPARALLDSGASQTAIDQTFAKDHGIAAIGRFLVSGQGGTVDTAYTPGVAIGAGAAKLDGVVANVIDLQQPGTRMSPPLIAILGAEVFAETAVDIDYANRRLRFIDPATVPRVADGVTLPLELFEGSFHFPISIEKRAPIPMLLDTGDNGALQLFPAYWQPRDMLKGRPSKESGNGGVGGMARYRLATLSSIGIGSIDLRDVPTAFQLPGNPASNETGILGNCGNAIYSRFHLLINFPSRWIMFGTPTKSS